MDIFLWKRDEYVMLYNCSFYDVDSIPLNQRQHVLIGVSLVVMFFIFEILYIPSLIVMRKPTFYQQSCYKIMFYMGVVDVLCMVMNGGFTGLFALTGDVFCSHPTLIYCLGTFGLGRFCFTLRFVLLYFSFELQIRNRKLFIIFC